MTENSNAEKSAAQVGYEAFVAFHDDQQGHQFPQPTWEQAPAIVRGGWEAAAEAMHGTASGPLPAAAEAAPMDHSVDGKIDPVVMSESKPKIPGASSLSE